MQDFGPDLMLADFVLAGGSALADKLGIPKAVMVPFLGAGIMNNQFGSGASLLATVPQFSSGLPRHMVSIHGHSQHLSQEDTSLLDSICDNRSALCCLACSVVLHAHSQKPGYNIGLSGTLLCLHRMRAMSVS